MIMRAVRAVLCGFFARDGKAYGAALRQGCCQTNLPQSFKATIDVVHANALPLLALCPTYQLSTTLNQYLRLLGSRDHSIVFKVGETRYRDLTTPACTGNTKSKFV
jgi:hypothetical protein